MKNVNRIEIMPDYFHDLLKGLSSLYSGGFYQRNSTTYLGCYKLPQDNELKEWPMNSVTLEMTPLTDAMCHQYCSRMTNHTFYALYVCMIIFYHPTVYHAKIAIPRMLFHKYYYNLYSYICSTVYI